MRRLQLLYCQLPVRRSLESSDHGPADEMYQSGLHGMINEGKQPACVQACPAEARLFGDILDPQSEISKKIASSRTELLMPNKGTKPNFFVVVSK